MRRKREGRQFCTAALKFVSRHSGAMQSIEPQMRNCASGNLEIPGLILRTNPE